MISNIERNKSCFSKFEQFNAEQLKARLICTETNGDITLLLIATSLADVTFSNVNQHSRLPASYEYVLYYVYKEIKCVVGGEKSV